MATSTGVVTLTDFLLARIAEDEAAARAASPGGWQYGDVDSVAGGTLYDESRSIATLIYEPLRDHTGSIVRHLLSTEADANGTHIARHDPARVLAECEAKRRIVELRAAFRRPDTTGDRWWSGRNDAAEQILRILALGYADHPDYRDEWRP